MNIDPNKLNQLFNLEEEKKPEMSSIAVGETIVKSSGNSTNSIEVAIDYAKAYEELAELIKIGREILDNAKVVIETNPDDSNTVNAASNMMNTLTVLVKQFTKIHCGSLDHQHKKELELMKIKAKKELLEFKLKELAKMKNRNSQQGSIDSDESTRLVPFCQEKIVEQIVEQQKDFRQRSEAATDSTDLELT